MFTRQTETSAVSSVVGTILMVALTVVLAAALGQFVFDLVETLNQPPQAGVVFRETQSGISPSEYQLRAVVNSLPNAERVEIRPSPPASYDGSALAGMSLSEVGASQTQAYPEGTFVVVVAHKGGNSAVVQTLTVGDD